VALGSKMPSRWTKVMRSRLTFRAPRLVDEGKEIMFPDMAVAIMRICISTATPLQSPPVMGGGGDRR